MYSEDFYLFLPSNVLSHDVSQPNTLSAYRTQLNKPLNLQSGSWDVALVEATYPVNVYNFPVPVHVGVSKFTFSNEGAVVNIDEAVVDVDTTEPAIPVGQHQSAENIIKMLNNGLRSALGKFPNRKTIGKHAETVIFAYDANSKKVKILSTVLRTKVDVSIMTLWMKPSDWVSNILGFNAESIAEKFAKKMVDYKPLTEESKEQEKLETLTIEADDVVDVHGGSNMLFVYSDVVEPVQVGNTAAPLLRSLPIVANTGQYMHTDRFIAPYYFPIQKTYINDVFVYMTDEQGNQIKFGKPGRVLLVLHFRKRLE